MHGVAREEQAGPVDGEVVGTGRGAEREPASLLLRSEKQVRERAP